MLLQRMHAGIIIDTFGELRSERAAKKAHMDNQCFICGIDRFTFDTKGKGFDAHIAHDHNMWGYLQLLVHLREKDENDFNGWESYVYKKVLAGDVSFMPLNKALILQLSDEADVGQQQLQRLEDQVQSLREQNDAMMLLLKQALGKTPSVDA
jgi:inositol 1,4,5-triphosphate receptor type 1